MLQQMLAAFQDLRIEIQDIIEDDKKAAVRLNIAGTHEGELMGIPGTGKKVLISNINMYRFEDDKVVELWQLMDLAGLLKQIGKTESS
jgi:steroid delta-isomerase-like uncharacterized protein